MKQLSILLVICLFSISAFSQGYSIPKSNGFDVESGVATSDDVTVDGKTFKVFKTTKGSAYVKAISKKGSKYPVWIGTKSNETIQYKGKAEMIRFSKKGTPFILVMSKRGYPYCKYLKKN